MTIDEAIEMLKDMSLDNTGRLALEELDAIQLGIEALKRIVYLRKDMDCPHWMTLQGETEE